MSFNDILNKEKEYKEILHLNNDTSDKLHNNDLGEGVSSATPSPTKDNTENTAQRVIDSLSEERDYLKDKYSDLVKAVNEESEYYANVDDIVLQILDEWEKSQKIYDEGLKKIEELQQEYKSIIKEMNEIKTGYTKEMNELMDAMRKDL